MKKSGCPTLQHIVEWLISQVNILGVISTSLLLRCQRTSLFHILTLMSTVPLRQKEVFWPGYGRRIKCCRDTTYIGGGCPWLVLSGTRALPPTPPSACCGIMTWVGRTVLMCRISIAGNLLTFLVSFVNVSSGGQCYPNLCHVALSDRRPYARGIRGARRSVVLCLLNPIHPAR